MDGVTLINEVFPPEPILQAVRSGKSAAVQLAPGQSLSPADIAASLDISQIRFLVAGKPHDLVSFADQISSGAALDGKAGRDEAFKVLTTVDAKCKSIVLVIMDANTLSSEATLQFLANAMVMQRRLCLVLIGSGALEHIVMSGMLAPVRKRFVLLSSHLAPDPASVPASEGEPLPLTMQVIQTRPAGTTESARRRLPIIPIAAGAGALAVVGVAALLWLKFASHPAAGVQLVSTPPVAVTPVAVKPVAATPPVERQLAKDVPQHNAATLAVNVPAQKIAAEPKAVLETKSQPKIAPVAILPPKIIAQPVRAPEIVKLPAGAFRMGSMLDRSEAPVHLVTVPSFSMAVHAVTVQMWSACVQAGACKPAGQGAPDAPVTNVSWDDANQYAAWLSATIGSRYRLPTEAEWEYGARAGSSARYAWGDTMLDGKAACADCKGAGHSAEVPETTAFPANSFGLFGMGGGVAEWVQDCWHKNYDGAPASAAKAWDVPGCPVRVLRGGSWGSKAVDIRSASRDSYDASVRYPTHGFRLVRMDAAAVISKPMPGKS